MDIQNLSLIEPEDADFEPLLEALHQLGGENFPVLSIIKIQVGAAQPIIAPSYWLFPETSEQSQTDQAMDTYGVLLKP